MVCLSNFFKECLPQILFSWKSWFLTDGENAHAQLWQTRPHPNNVPRLSISLHIHKTDSEVKMRVHLSAYSTATSGLCKHCPIPLKFFVIVQWISKWMNLIRFVTLSTKHMAWQIILFLCLCKPSDASFISIWNPSAYKKSIYPGWLLLEAQWNRN